MRYNFVMNHKIKQLAIIGPTASGKSDLAIKIALHCDAYILSIDSLSIYKEIDIVSAKPSKNELKSVKHFGIDAIAPNEHFSVQTFIELYKKIYAQALKEKKNLLIVGGTSFYLKILLEGLSEIPHIDPAVEAEVNLLMRDQNAAYELLKDLDPTFMQNIAPNDSYRTHKALLIHKASGQTPSAWFEKNPPKPIIEALDVFNIDVDRDILRDRIASRTQKMLDAGLIDEICTLEKKYTRAINPMKAIGIVEVLEFLDGKISYEKMQEQITTHTAQLAKRQQTFNKTQFNGVMHAPLDALEEIIFERVRR